MKQSISPFILHALQFAAGACLFFGLTLPAVAATEPLASAGATAPIQSYQTADITHNSSSAESSQAVQQTTMPQSKPRPAIQPVNNNSPDQSASVALNRQQAQILQAELTQLNQNNLLFQQKTDERLIELAVKNQLLVKQVVQLQQMVATLNRELVSLQRADTSPRPAQSKLSGINSRVAEFMSLVRRYFSPDRLKLLGMAMVLMVVLLVWVVWPRSAKKSGQPQRITPHAKPHDDIADDTQGEYDYMGSAEGIPAKLDLARTYVAMEDYGNARRVLKEVLQHGKAEHKQAAQALIKALPAKT